MLAGCAELIGEPAASRRRLSEIKPGGGIVVTRVRVSTDGEEGSPLTLQPLEINFNALPSAAPPLIEFPSSTHWYRPGDGLIATWVPATRYGSRGFGYAESAVLPGSGFPPPGGGLFFTPIAVEDGEIVYLGDIDVRQSYSFLGAVFNVSDMEFEVRDDFDQTVSAFRERYPELQERPVAHRVLQRIPFKEWNQRRKLEDAWGVGHDSTAADTQRLVGEYDGAGTLKLCASGATRDVVMTSNAAGTFLLKARDLGARSNESLVIEVDAIPLSRNFVEVLFGDEPTLGIGRVHAVRRGTCLEGSSDLRGLRAAAPSTH